MENGIDAEKETLQSLVRSCLLELNKLKFELTELEVEKANDNSASRIRELEQDIVALMNASRDINATEIIKNCTKIARVK